MSKLHIYIDGSWLFSACKPSGVLANATATPETAFKLDFARLSNALLAHCAAKEAGITLGEQIISTSIFEVPAAAKTWADSDPDLLPADLEKTKRNIVSRDIFVKRARAGKYSEEAVYRPVLRPYIVKALARGSYQEKLVDATIVALLVRNAITMPSDFHVVLTGDADILPAINVAYPKFTRNVFVSTTHPDELKKEHRSSSFSISEYPFEIEPFYLQDHVQTIMAGAHIYLCGSCRKPYESQRAVTRPQRPYCPTCLVKKRT